MAMEGNSSEEMKVSMDTMEEQVEDIDDSLEDLLIFPTQKGLNRSVWMIQAYFAMEEKMMQQLQITIGRDEPAYQSILEKQQGVLDIAKNEMDRKARVAVLDCKSGWIPAPKSIDKGVDKNVAARLASGFARHAEMFKEMCEDATK